MSSSRYVSPAEMQFSLVILFVFLCMALVALWPIAAAFSIIEWLKRLFPSRFTPEQLMRLADLEAHAYDEHVQYAAVSELPAATHEARRVLIERAGNAGLDPEDIQDALDRGAKRAYQLTTPDLLSGGPLG